MITINEEIFTEVYPELEEMFKEHYKEAPLYTDIEVDPLLDVYEKIEEQGNYLFLVARDDGVPVGYISYMIHPALQFHNQVIAGMELIYVLPTYRSKGVATSLLKAAEEVLQRDKGVTIASLVMKSGTPIRGFAEAMGYKEMEVMFTKRLGESLWQ